MGKKFASKIPFNKLFWIFLIGSIIGAYYEEILYAFKYYFSYGEFSWSPRRGVFWGPLSPIYGMGAVLFTLLLAENDDKWYISFLKAAIAGGILEYGINFLQEFFLGTTSWNYADRLLNINGRTTVPYMFFWGLLGLIYLKIVYPLISKVMNSIPKDIGDKITKQILIIVTIDIIISWSALIRQTLRYNGVPPLTVIDEVYDKYFDDDYINKKFPNMERR